MAGTNSLTHYKVSAMEKVNPVDLRAKYPHTSPAVLTETPVFGLGYRSPWILGNEVQARVAAKFNLNIMLAQQSAREIERTGRSFQEVIDSATVSAFAADLRRPWGADGDHLRNVAEVTAAANAGCTHFTYDVSHELSISLDAVVARLRELFQVTVELKGAAGFTTEISMDETEHTTRLDDVRKLMGDLGKADVRVDEIAPRFPGYFEKAIDYYSCIKDRRRVCDTADFEAYLQQIAELSRELGFRICVHSGSDKFSIYPIIAKVLGSDFHLKTAGTYYLEELKIAARHDPDFFRQIYDYSMEHFQQARATYELSTMTEDIPDLRPLSGAELGRLLQSGEGNDELRQVLHVGYGSVLTERDADGRPRFADRLEQILHDNAGEYATEMENHLRRHIRAFVAGA
ncbi:MAG: tagaturonate epimerase family protein [Lentisphaerae bacterium]|nr:tagaturonate epimerase family protein [Lentisphaerota bacterium]